MCGETWSVRDRSNDDIMPGGDPPDAEGLTGRPSSNGLRPPTHEVTEGWSLDSTEGHEINFECVASHKCISREESELDTKYLGRLHHCM